MRLMRMSYVPKHAQDHANSEYISDVGSLSGAEFIGNKNVPHSLTYIKTAQSDAEMDGRTEMV